MTRSLLFCFLSCVIATAGPAQDELTPVKSVKVPAIFRAIQTKNYDLFSQLVRKKEQREGLNQHGATPLIEAVKSGWQQAVDELLRRGVALENRDAWGWTALSIAASDGKLELAKKLIQAGADFNAKDNENISALSWAAINGYKEVVVYLLELGADFASISKAGNSAIDYAVTNGNCSIYKTLKAKGALPSEKYQNQLSAFLGSACLGKLIQMADSGGNVPDVIIKTTQEPSPTTEQEPLETIESEHEDYGSAAEPAFQFLVDPAWDSTFVDQMQTALQAFSDKNYSLALEHFKQAELISKQESLFALYWLSRTYMMLRQREEALAHFENYLSKATLPLEKASALTHMATIYSLGSSADKQKATALFKSAFETSHCRLVEAYLSYASFCMQENREEEALLAYQELLALNLKPEMRSPFIHEEARLREQMRRPRLKELEQLELHFEGGGTSTFSAMKGQVTLVAFWSTWSIPYQNALPRIKEILEKYKGKPLTELAVNLNVCGTAVASFAESQQTQMPRLLIQNNPKLLTLASIQQLPAFAVVDVDGELKALEQGWGKKQEENLLKALDKAFVRQEQP